MSSNIEVSDRHSYSNHKIDIEKNNQIKYTGLSQDSQDSKCILGGCETCIYHPCVLCLLAQSLGYLLGYEAKMLLLVLVLRQIIWHKHKLYFHGEGQEHCPEG